ncbi:MAG: flagellar M-ring protein FliF [Shimia sp.]|uniref:flagellar basal-body MS-ring/collar protein FliF n=1 Tax=Shimia sp. TaxID=1954381 RepID=UPI001B2A4E43|nr:flagellar basal-body MS-ring/collar protein FliF [Shimia sp.]MBO6898088.1 flagellar M-ring protein FliF [Shimia sp.]
MTDNSTNTSLAPVRSGLAQRATMVMTDLRMFYVQPAVQRAFPVVAAAILVVLGLIFYIALQTPQRTTLFASLPEAEKAAVMDALRNNGTDVQIDPVSGDVTVPVSDYHTSRMTLAAQGLPQSMPDGYSILTDMPMGTSRSVESMRLKQTQEVELARSINEIDVVSASRVHLAIPERSAFARNAQAPTASVFVQVRPGRSLSSQQVTAIVNLVSSSVANLPKTSVTVVDQNGRLLSDTVDDPATTLADRQLEYQLKLEEIYRARIETLLTPIVGPGHVSAQVSLEIDFTRREVTEDLVVPGESGLLSEQNVLEEEVVETSRGIPGAIGNTPPPAPELEGNNVNAEAPDAGEGETLADPDGAPDAVQNSNIPNTAADGEGTRLRSTNNLRNYEMSRRVSSESSPLAKIQGIHVAVLLRERLPTTDVTDADAPAELSVGLDPSRIDEVKALVERTVGINAARGDTLIVSSLPFISPEAVIAAMSEGTEFSWYEDPWVREMMRNLLTLMVLAVVVLGLIKPLLTQFLTAPADGQGPNVITTEDGEIIDMDTIELHEGQSLEEIKAKLKPKKSSISVEMLDTANSYDDKVALIRMIVGDEAGRVSNVFKAMMEEDMDQSK